MRQYRWRRGSLAFLASTSPARATANQTLGRAGEDAALALAVARGWSPWRRNIKLPIGEVDLALLRQADAQTQLLVVEVKTSRRPILQPERRWSVAQRRRLWAIAAVLAADAKADVVQVALILVVLQGSSETVTWLPIGVDDIGLDRRGW